MSDGRCVAGAGVVLSLAHETPLRYYGAAPVLTATEREALAAPRPEPIAQIVPGEDFAWRARL